VNFKRCFLAPLSSMKKAKEVFGFAIFEKVKEVVFATAFSYF
jgi:hypothetical protein